ncbi:MAG TPA: CapA family protein [Euzebyales bacterium]|nr:CapA family protein [Euzebyales bacterium]
MQTVRGVLVRRRAAVIGSLLCVAGAALHPAPAAVGAPPSAVAPADPAVVTAMHRPTVTSVEPDPVAPADQAAATPVDRSGTTPPGSRARPARARRVTVAVTGDVLPHQPVLQAARDGDGYDFAPLLRGIRGPIGRADLALCHLEVPLARDHERLSTYPVFNAPPELADGLAAVGYDGCSVASNHSFDQGVAGVRATLEALDRAGLGHAGTARTRRESRRIRQYRVDGVRIAHLSYTYGLNGFVLPADRPWLVNLIDRDRILRDARRARRERADVVLVSLHWGTEYVAEPTQQQRRLARRLLASPHIDALVGHHAHVVQPVERVGGKVVVYGLGNLLSNQSAACCAAATQDGVVVALTFAGVPGERFEVGAVRYWPTIVRHPQRRVVLVERLLSRTGDPDLRRQLEASRRRTRAVIGDVATPGGR